jgi:hypothetical protein
VSQVRILPGPPDVSAAQKAFTLTRCQTNHRGPALAPHWPRIASATYRRDRPIEMVNGASIEVRLKLRSPRRPGRIAITDEIEFERLIR